jgi:hypothetical protein
MQNKPNIISFPSVGASDIGYLSIGEIGKAVPFEIKRVFWTYYTPDSILRGRHAHYETEMILIAVSGRIIVTTEMPGMEPEVYILEKPNEGLFLPKMCWHTMQYSHSSVQLVLASTCYSESEYIREYNLFKTYEKN